MNTQIYWNPEGSGAPPFKLCKIKVRGEWLKGARTRSTWNKTPGGAFICYDYEVEDWALVKAEAQA